MNWFESVAYAKSLPQAVPKFSWRRREQRDAVVVFGLLIVFYFVAEYGDLPEKIFRFAVDHAGWEIDDILVMGAMMSIAMIAYGYRRLQDLSREVRARRAAEAEAHVLARHDPLTGLPNRRFFEERLDDILGEKATARRTAVLMLDLDGFKSINDMHGHRAGDRALDEFARRVSAAIRPGTVFARLGGDEFGIILSKIGSLDEPAAVARRIVSAIALPLSVDGVTTSLGVGIGIAVAPDNGSGHDELVRRADLAMYRAKAEGRSQIRFFAPEMDALVERRTRIERELRAAVAADAVEPHYQPLVSLDGNRIIGFEALARWSSESGPVPPMEFIAIAEESGFIDELGDKLLRRACRDAATWPDELTLAFNISPMQLRDPLLGLRILAILGETGLRPQRLELELTESALVDNIELAQQAIDQLRAAGIRVALDDFGTGYATLSQLLSLRLDKIKIDRSFVQRLGGDPESLVIIRAVIGLANGFGLTTTAEGVENADQLDCLKSNGCIEGQGYLFGKAIAASEVPALLQSTKPPMPAVAAVA